MPPKVTEYTAAVGLNYPTAKGEARVEAGDVVTDLPSKSISWLRDQGLIIAGNVPLPDPPPADVTFTPEPEAADGNASA